MYSTRPTCASASPKRSRHGYRDRDQQTGAGTAELRIPKLRRGSYFAKLPRAAPHGREGTDGGDPGCHIQGIWTRSVDELVEALGLEGISKSQVSRLCEKIDERVQAFLDRPIEGDWPYVWLEATDVTVRRDRHIVLSR